MQGLGKTLVVLALISLQHQNVDNIIAFDAKQFPLAKVLAVMLFFFPALTEFRHNKADDVQKQSNVGDMPQSFSTTMGQRGAQAHQSSAQGKHLRC